MSSLNGIFCELVDKHESNNIIYKLKPNKSPGPNNIAPKLVKEMAEWLVDLLVHLFNLSLSTGIIPNNFKTANVIQVFNKGDPQIPSYRPISLSNVFSKLLEKSNV